jgi:hypothetical protein
MAVLNQISDDVEFRETVWTMVDELEDSASDSAETKTPVAASEQDEDASQDLLDEEDEKNGPAQLSQKHHRFLSTSLKTLSRPRKNLSYPNDPQKAKPSWKNQKNLTITIYFLRQLRKDES